MFYFFGVRSDMWSFACVAFFVLARKHLITIVDDDELKNLTKPYEGGPSKFIKNEINMINEDEDTVMFLTSLFSSIERRPDRIDEAPGYLPVFDSALKLSEERKFNLKITELLLS